MNVLIPASIVGGAAVVGLATYGMSNATRKDDNLAGGAFLGGFVLAGVGIGAHVLRSGPGMAPAFAGVAALVGVVGSVIAGHLLAGHGQASPYATVDELTDDIVSGDLDPVDKWGRNWDISVRIANLNGHRRDATPDEVRTFVTGFDRYDKHGARAGDGLITGHDIRALHDELKTPQYFA